jgi:hypothetical protein
MATRPSFADLKAEYDKLKAKHADELSALGVRVSQAARLEGFEWRPLGVKRYSKMQETKTAQHNRKREECIKHGWLKADGSADLERYRVEAKAKKLKITPAEVVKREIAARAKRQAERFKR